MLSQFWHPNDATLKKTGVTVKIIVLSIDNQFLVFFLLRRKLLFISPGAVARLEVTEKENFIVPEQSRRDVQFDDVRSVPVPLKRGGYFSRHAAGPREVQSARSPTEPSSGASLPVVRAALLFQPQSDAH